MTERIPTVRYNELEPIHAEQLKNTPALIVDHGLTPRMLQRTIARRRHDRVVNWLSGQTGQPAIHEARDFASTAHGFPAHVDGIVERYWQVNTSILNNGEAKRRNGGARFTLDAYRLPVSLETLKAEQITDGYNPFDEGTTLNLASNRRGEGRGILGLLKDQGYQPPELIRRFEGHVPLGGTVIFVNGAGLEETDVYFHATRTAIRQPSGELKDTFMFTRQIILSRVAQAPAA